MQNKTILQSSVASQIGLRHGAAARHMGRGGGAAAAVGKWNRSRAPFGDEAKSFLTPWLSGDGAGCRRRLPDDRVP